MSYDKLFETDDIVIEDEKTGKKTIKTILSPKYKDSSKKHIYSPLRSKYLDAQPEEIVRQEFICKLISIISCETYCIIRLYVIINDTQCRVQPAQS